MTITIFQELFDKDLDRLINEINLYKQEENLWKINSNISNSAGNLCLHINGNLNAFIGAVFGNTGYVRNREAEFIQKNIKRIVLIDDLIQTKKIVFESLKNIDESDLYKLYPQNIRNNNETILQLLIHLQAHLNYHLGQINYHRRILDQNK